MENRQSKQSERIGHPIDSVDDLLANETPADLEAEQLLLSAALVANPRERTQIVRSVSTYDLHDPFHAWLLGALRALPAAEFDVDGFRLLQGHPRPEWVGPNWSQWTARLLCNRAGQLIAGKVRHWRAYRDLIKTAAKRRAELDHAIATIQRIAAEQRDFITPGGVHV